MNKHIKVFNGQTSSEPFSLFGTYVAEDGTTISKAEDMTQEQKDFYHLMPVTENIPSYDTRSQSLIPTYTANATDVTLSYTVVSMPETYQGLVDEKLASFASEKNIDIQEIPMLLKSNNVEWVAEATRFQSLYLQTQELFETLPIATMSWAEVEAALPTLTWL